MSEITILLAAFGGSILGTLVGMSLFLKWFTEGVMKALQERDPP